MHACSSSPRTQPTFEEAAQTSETLDVLSWLFPVTSDLSWRSAFTRWCARSGVWGGFDSPWASESSLWVVFRPRWVFSSTELAFSLFCFIRLVVSFLSLIEFAMRLGHSKISVSIWTAFRPGRASSLTGLAFSTRSLRYRWCHLFILKVYALRSGHTEMSVWF